MADAPMGPVPPHMHGRQFGFAYQRGFLPQQSVVVLSILEEGKTTTYPMPVQIAQSLLAILKQAVEAAQKDLTVPPMPGQN